MSGPLGRAVHLVVLASVVIAACSAAGMSLRPAANDRSTVPTDRVAVTPAETIQATVGPPTAAPIGEPPAASIAVDGGDPVVGELGSYAWQNRGSDSPWLDGRPIHIGAGETLALTLAEPVTVDTWTASRVAAATLDDTTAVGLGEGTGSVPVVFAGPPSGTWSVRVSVWFAGNLGSATYYWRVEVD